MKVYSCSSPNSGSWAAYLSATATQAARVLEAWGVKSVLRTSHMTSRSSGPRSGSGQLQTGLSTQSELSPVAWLVLDPSKPQMPGSLPSGTILVLLRIIGDGSVPSIQMYSAWKATWFLRSSLRVRRRCARRRDVRRTVLLSAPAWPLTVSLPFPDYEYSVNSGSPRTGPRRRGLSRPAGNQQSSADCGEAADVDRRNSRWNSAPRRR